MMSGHLKIHRLVADCGTHFYGIMLGVKNCFFMRPSNINEFNQRINAAVNAMHNARDAAYCFREGAQDDYSLKLIWRTHFRNSDEIKRLSLTEVFNKQSEILKEYVQEWRDQAISPEPSRRHRSRYLQQQSEISFRYLNLDKASMHLSLLARNFSDMPADDQHFIFKAIQPKLHSTGIMPEH